MKDPIIVAGAGPVGVATAILLGEAGRPVRVLERHADPRADRRAGLQSINLALSYRGLKTLNSAGALADLAPWLSPMRGRLVHGAKLAFQAYDLLELYVVYSAQRMALLEALLGRAESIPGVSIEFNAACCAVNFDQHSVVVDRGNRFESIRFHALIGADGCRSVVRQALDRVSGKSTSLQLLDHSYREIVFTAAHARQYGLRVDALHIWPGGEYMLIALPNPDGSFTGTLFLPADGPDGFAALDSPDRAAEFLQTRFASAPPIPPAFPETWFTRAPGRIVIAHAEAWTAPETRAVVIGDAAHAIAPFFGQGVNCGLEDALIVSECLCAEDDPDRAFAGFEARRRADARAIAGLSLDNYVEMRKTVTERDYSERRAIARDLQCRYPTRFVPLYSMVSFSDVPYSEAERRHRAQLDLINRVRAGATAVSSPEVDQLARSQFAPIAPAQDFYLQAAAAGAIGIAC